jgi:Lrp/AsnC family transcriptional regulator, leucine-responsive regulatory protein
MNYHQNEGYIVDAVDKKLIDALSANARRSMRDLAGLAGMSAPSVADRVRRLEDLGLLRGYTVDLDLKVMGYPLQALVRVKPLPGQLHMVERMIQEMPECVECDKVTGEDCYILRLCLRSIDQLDPMLDRLHDKAETNTSIVKSSPVPRRAPPLLVKG